MKHTSYIILSVLLFIAVGTPLKAQSSSKQESACPIHTSALINDRKAYIKQQLSLTDEESEVVSATLTDIDKQRAVLWKRVRTQRAELKKKGSAVTQEEVLAFYKLQQKVKEQEAAITYEKEVELAKVLSPEKLLRLDEVCKGYMHHFMSQQKKRGNPYIPLDLSTNHKIGLEKEHLHKCFFSKGLNLQFLISFL